MAEHAEQAVQAERSLAVWSTLDDPRVLRLLLAARPGWVVLDAQHGAWTERTLTDVLLTLETDVPVWVRLGDDRARGIGRALDAGASGVVVPLVESVEQAAAAAAACRYPPTGRRSFGPMQGLVGRTAPGTAEADAAVRCAVMVETAAGLERVSDIAAVPGVDAVFVGPNDLSLSLGTTLDALLADDDEGAPLPAVVAACRAAGVRAGAYGGDATRGRRLLELGFTDVVVATDTGLLSAAAAAAVR
ncbi:HpcH/HpaI aldolase/citrate lyase family protein [Streptomyces sp. NP160]|uniref:HpcH/HpaI aldolase family protein n=1 Tax=Streptomyces sp. NP160 TaxID=2586637 RepID=UPI0015D58938|nr:aldolase/citrate lyase family protein [Streptomyces sp. NP160]